MAWDLLIKGGMVVGPGQRLHAVTDIAISDKKIDRVEADLDASQSD